jgi:hypothetical protein
VARLVTPKGFVEAVEFKTKASAGFVPGIGILVGSKELLLISEDVTVSPREIKA